MKKLILFCIAFIFSLVACQQESIKPTKTPYRIAQMHFKLKGVEKTLQVTYYRTISRTPTGVDFGINIGDCRCCPEVLKIIQAQNLYFKGLGVEEWTLSDDNGYFCE